MVQYINRLLCPIGTQTIFTAPCTKYCCDQKLSNSFYVKFEQMHYFSQHIETIRDIIPNR